MKALKIYIFSFVLLLFVVVVSSFSIKDKVYSSSGSFLGVPFDTSFFPKRLLNLRNKNYSSIKMSITSYTPRYHSWELHDGNIKTVVEEGDEIDIRTASLYYERFYSGDRFYVPESKYGSIMGEFGEEYPKVMIYFINNSKRTYSLDRLEIDVEQSIPDTRPYYNIYTHGFERCCEMRILNRGFSDEPYLELDYTILRDGETFDGIYKNKRILSSNDVSVSFLDDIIKMGLDYDALLKNDLIDVHIDGTVPSVSIYSGFKKLGSVRKLFSPFPVYVSKIDSCGREYYSRIDCSEDSRYRKMERDGEEQWYFVRAPLYGSLTFPSTGENITFYAELYVAGFQEIQGANGALSQRPSFYYNLEFEPSQINYHSYLSFAFREEIRADDVTCVLITLKCSQSSFHQFKIRLFDDEGLIFTSKRINLQYFNPNDSFVKKENSK